MTIKVKKLIDKIQANKKILVTFKELAIATSKEQDEETIAKKEEALKRRAYRNGNFSDKEKFMIAKHFNIDVALFSEEKEERETIVVDYYENHKVPLIKNPAFKNYYMDRELAKSYNPNYKDSDFKILCALDDAMDGGELWIHTHDVVLLDVSYNEVIMPAMYVYECQNGKYMRAAFIEEQMDGNYKFTYKNAKYETQIRTPEFLEEVKFKVVGRIIKNLMFFA